MKTLLTILVFILANEALATELTVVKVNGQTPIGTQKVFVAADIVPASAEKKALEMCHDSGSVDCQGAEELQLADIGEK